jgi:hypothetical protein
MEEIEIKSQATFNSGKGTDIVAMPQTGTELAVPPTRAVTGRFSTGTSKARQ